MSKGKGKSERSELRDKNSYGEETTSISAPLLSLARRHIDRSIEVDMNDGFCTYIQAIYTDWISIWLPCLVV